MKPSLKISLIAAAIATIGIGGIAKMGAASLPNPSLMAAAHPQVKSRTNEANELAQLQQSAKISAIPAQPIVEAPQGKQPTSTYAYAGEELAKNAKVSLFEARQIALEVHPGKIMDEELELESGGSGLRYSFDIKQGATTYEVGVDAKTGKVLENAHL